MDVPKGILDGIFEGIYTSPIMGYAGGGGGTNESATGTTGSIPVGSPGDRSGAGL